ncbi:Hypothetical predicted protein [Mytilus galloprovincialis]|nr:Hypothetical predicted protein [Mytilus galloprovincialis]
MHELLQSVNSNEREILSLKRENQFLTNLLENRRRQFSCEINELYENNMEHQRALNDTNTDIYHLNVTIEELRNGIDKLEELERRRSEENITQCIEKSATWYNEYYVMFTEGYRSSATTPRLYMYSTQNGTATIFSLHTNSNESIQLSKGENRFDLPSSILTKDGKERKGVYVQTSIPVVLYPFELYIDSSDGFLALPKQVLSKYYIVPSFKVYKHRSISKSLIGIVATTDEITNVQIKLRLLHNTKIRINSKEFNNGETLSVVLSKLQTFQISHDYDLSGSVITSTQPVGVVSGNICNSVNHPICNHFTEMILPTNQLDSDFIIPKIQNRPSSIVRVYCPVKTQLRIFNLTTEISVSLQKEDIFEFENVNVSVIKSDNKVLVMSYPTEAGQFDSYMMTIYGINQYKTDYSIVVPDDFTSYISVTFTSGSADGFRIDQKRVLVYKLYRKQVAGTTYSTMSCNITAGSHTINHESNIHFGLWIYGDRVYDGYGFPAGIAFNHNP